MTVSGIRWNQIGEDGFDIHVLAGDTSRRLDEVLVIDQTGGDPSVFASSPPAGVTVQFNPQFSGAPNNHGVNVNTSTGAVTVTSPLPAGTHLRNFIINCVVIEGAKRFTQKIRIHVHAAIVKMWLTPGALTVREGAQHVRFSVFAKFDDEVIGDISNWTDLVWNSSAPASIGVDPASGVLDPKTRGTNATISVSIPPLPPAPNLTDSAPVTCVEPWSTPNDLTFIDGRGAAQHADVPNILFVSDGFEAGEKAAFDLLVKNIVRKLRTWQITRPFDLLNGSLNFWYVFVPSPQGGINVGPELDVFSRPGGLRGIEVPLPQEPAAGAASWTLAELIHEVGLPVPVDDPAHRPLTGAGGKLSDWQALYGAKVTQARVQGVYDQWLELRDRTLVNEKNTTFGLIYGERPRLQQFSVPRSLGFFSKRMSDNDLDDFLGHLRHGGNTIGTTWTTGKDKGLVCIISRGLHVGGSNAGKYFTTSLTRRSEHNLSASATGTDLRVVAFSSRPVNTLVANVAHESAHSLSLLDEYGEGQQLNFPDDRINQVAKIGNVQPQKELNRPAGGLDETKIKWRWQRIEHAGVLVGQPQPVAGNSFTITLRAGHAAGFNPNDTVRLRARPLLEHPDPSFKLRITAINPGDILTVEQIEGLPLAVDPALFPAGSILFRPTLDGAGNDLLLVSQPILDQIRNTGGPLNAPANNPTRTCTRDDRAMLPATNRPAGLPAGRPRWSAWLVGIYEGGAAFYCGIFHPTGVCLMRQIEVPTLPNRIYKFCPVCRYVMVDILDPTKHADIEKDYAANYP